MANSKTVTVEEHISKLPEDKKDDIVAIRKLILKNLPKGYNEVVAYNMLAYVIPLEQYPKTYNKQPLMYLGLAAQKNYNSLHMVTVYMNPKLEKQLKDGFASSGKKLDMGKGCVRFKSANDLDHKTIAKIISTVTPADYIKTYEAIKGSPKK